LDLDIETCESKQQVLIQHDGDKQEVSRKKGNAKQIIFTYSIVKHSIVISRFKPHWSNHVREKNDCDFKIQTSLVKSCP
jgi:hypothetical protein